MIINTLISLFRSARLSIPFFRKSINVKFMEFNIEEGGKLVSFEKTIEAIKAVNPDIIAIEEANGNIPELAQMLGMKYYNNRFQVISRFPLIDPSCGKGFFIFAELVPNKVIAISNVHLPSDPYGPSEFFHDASASDILKLENQIRLPTIKKYLSVLGPLLKESFPIILAGDFNSPSHQDWDEIEWPVSKAVISAGFRDSYRELFPDTKKHPGHTWCASRPKVTGWNPNLEDTQDRIDFIFVSGSIKTIQNKIIGEVNSPYADIAILPWPSDHRAIVSTLAIVPAVPPNYIAVQNRVIQSGDNLTVLFHAPGNSGEKIIVSYPGVPERKCNEKRDGRFSYSTQNWMPGKYEAKLLNDRDDILASIQFYINPRNKKIMLLLNKKIYHRHEPIIVHWYFSQGNRFDWIVVVNKNQVLNEENILQSVKTEADIIGAHTFLSLLPGDYEILFLIDDGFEIAARVSFSVV
ncbi:MAG: hypothetical protein K2X50_03070 [Gammaproteobacteria bacterium]|nr:hypothetical protein [Gammaproteobacteria bacterium]